MQDIELHGMQLHRLNMYKVKFLSLIFFYFIQVQISALPFRNGIQRAIIRRFEGSGDQPAQNKELVSNVEFLYVPVDANKGKNKKHEDESARKFLIQKRLYGIGQAEELQFILLRSMGTQKYK